LIIQKFEKVFVKLHILTWSDSPGTSSTSQRLVSLVLRLVRFFKSLPAYVAELERAGPRPVEDPVLLRLDGLSVKKNDLI